MNRQEATDILLRVVCSSKVHPDAHKALNIIINDFAEIYDAIQLLKNIETQVTETKVVLENILNGERGKV